MRQMKDSGIEWIGEIPEGWEVRKIKNIAFPKSIQNHPQEEVLSLYRDFGVIIKSSRDDNFNRTSENTTNYKFVEVGDLVINKMKAWQGSLAISWYQGIVSPAYYVFKLTSDIIEKKFLHYLLRSSSYLPEYRRISGGIRPNQWDLDITEFKKIPVLIPPLPEQQRIADYLDAKCAHIDQCLELIRQSMEKLRAYKLSCITEAVTKGLDPDVPLKDSGVPWIGQIPAGWEAVKLKYIMQSIIDCPHETPQYDNDGIYYVIRTADQDIGRLKSHDSMYRLNQDQYDIRTRRSTLEKNDIVYGREGERWGLACLVPSSNKYCLGQRMMQFRCKHDINSQFIMWQLNSYTIYRQGIKDTFGSTSPHVNISTIQNFIFLLPPLPEQERIAAYLDKKCARIDALLEEKQALLDKLAEYKKSLIFECVTGKREVPSCWNR